MIVWKELKYWMYEINLLNEIRDPSTGNCGTWCGHWTWFYKEYVSCRYLLIRLKVVMYHRLTWTMYMCSYKAMCQSCTLDLGYHKVGIRALGFPMVNGARVL